MYTHAACRLVVINWLDVYTVESGLSTGDGATRARGSRCYQLIPWYHTHNILLNKVTAAAVLIAVLCCA